MANDTRTLGRIVATLELTPAQIKEVTGGEFFSDTTYNVSPDTLVDGRPSDCSADG